MRHLLRSVGEQDGERVMRVAMENEVGNCTCDYNDHQSGCSVFFYICPHSVGKARGELADWHAS